MSLNLQTIFEKYNGEYLKFENVKDRICSRPDLHAFMLLHQLVPSGQDIIVSAEHDEIWLDIATDYLSEVATEEQICDLIRCGIRYDTMHECLCMFV